VIFPFTSHSGLATYSKLVEEALGGTEHLKPLVRGSQLVVDTSGWTRSKIIKELDGLTYMSVVK
jgi:hypothetical protein